MRLSDEVIEAVQTAGVETYFADRSITKFWNGMREGGTPIQFGGWYWQQVRKGTVIETDDEGPFRSRSAAIRDAYVKLQLRWAKPRRAILGSSTQI